MNKCKLLDWTGVDQIVAEGRWQSKDPTALVNGLPLGPKAVKVFVDVVLQPHTYLWRPTTEMALLDDSVKASVAWPVHRVIFETTTDSDSDPHEESPAAQDSPINISPTTPASPTNIAPAETPQAPIKKAQTLSQPQLRRSPVSVAINCFISFDICCLVMLCVKLCYGITFKYFHICCVFTNVKTWQRKMAVQGFKENQKCKLLDVTGKNEIVAEGRWASNNPDQLVHHVPLGPNTVRVWVDVVKVKTAKVWRQSSEIESMADAIGTNLAWPKDKVVDFYTAKVFLVLCQTLVFCWLLLNIVRVCVY